MVTISEEKRRIVQSEIEKLAPDGISCTVEGDTIICTGEILKTEQEQIRIPATEFSADVARRKFDEKQQPQL